MAKERIEKLKALAYELGYEVGLKGHDEWTSWVYREKKKLLAEGRKIATARVVEAAYEEGRSRGMWEKRKEKEAEDIKSRVRFIPKGKVKAIEKPTFVSRPRMVKMSKALRLPRFLRLLK